MTSKSQERFLNLQRAYARKQIKSILETPFTCPHCSRPNSLRISSPKPAYKSTTREFTCSCRKCGLYKVLYLPLSFGAPDAYSKIFDSHIPHSQKSLY